jgi:glycerol-3-phosphate dehydrogenase
MVSSPVLVIGGGATGAGIARDLALSDVDVTLVESGGLAGGTSGRSHGLLHSGARYAESDPVGAEECIEESQIIKDITGECIRDTGGLFVQLAEDDPAYFEEKREACEEVGIPTTTIDGEEAREMVPELSADVEQAMEVPDGVVYPSRLVAANAVDAENHGASIHHNAPVEDMTVTDGEIESVSVGGDLNEEMYPEYVVNATGAWAGEIGEMVGVDIDMRPTKGVMISVEYEDLGPVLNRCRDPDDGDIIVPHEREAVLGTTSVEVGDPEEYPKEEWEVEKTFAECAAMLPPVADAPEVRTWWGVRPLYAPDEEGDGRSISRGFFRLDHADDGVENFASIVGGKLTTYRQMAESAADLVRDRIGVDADSSTADRRLPGADDPEQLDAFVARFGGANPTDSSTVSAAGD